MNSKNVEECKNEAKSWDLSKQWYIKDTINYEQWRTRMYGFGSFRTYDDKKLFALSDSLPDLKTLFSKEKNGDKKKLYVYVHIPYCIRKCLFCYFNTEFLPKDEFIDRYVDALIKNIDMIKDAMEFEIEPAAIHFGGGTPTLIGAERMDRLTGAIKEKLNVGAGVPWTVEATPDSLLREGGVETLRAMKKNGVTRLSLGVQTFSDEVLKVTKRAHSASDAVNAIKIARENGFDNINIDLLLGMPGQNMNNWIETLDKLDEIRTESVTLYYIKWLDYFKNQEKMYDMRENDISQFPTNEETLQMDLLLFKHMKDMGYVLNRPCSWTREEKYFSYPEYSDILPIGAAAFTFFDNYHMRNLNESNEYIQAIESGKLPFINSCAQLTEEYLELKKFSSELQFINEKGIDLDEFYKEIPEDKIKKFEKICEILMNEGLVKKEGSHALLTEKGCLCADEIVKFIITFGGKE